MLVEKIQKQKILGEFKKLCTIYHKMPDGYYGKEETAIEIQELLEDSGIDFDYAELEEAINRYKEVKA